MPPLVVRLSRWKYLLLSAIMFAFVGMAGVLAIADESSDTLDPWVGILFFGTLGVVLLVLALRNKPVITLNDAGIDDPRLKMGVIPWSEIERAYEVSYFWQKNVQLQVRHPEQFRQRQPALLRTLGSLSKGLGVSPFTLNMQYTNTSAKTVVDYIYRRLVQHWPVPGSAEQPSAAQAEQGEY